VRLAQTRDGDGEQTENDSGENAGIEMIHGLGEAFRVTSDAT
jgi:hypothetical protein